MLLSSFSKQLDDSSHTSFMKRLILGIALTCSVCGFIWSLIYYQVFGVGVVMALPLVFSGIVGASIVVSHLLKNHYILLYTQLASVTGISAIIQWSIGSMHDSGLVIVWCFLGPIGALIFLPVRQASIWMGMFVVIVIISSVFEPQLLGEKLTVTSGQRILFYNMNIVTLSIVVFVTATWFAKTIQSERSKSEDLKDKIKHLLEQHVSNAVAGELLSKDETHPISKACDATIMFLDIRDFTLFADSRAPSEVANFQNLVFSELINVVESNRGVVVQLLGDGIYAVFGAPEKNDTHQSDAVTSGIQMIEKIKLLSTEGKIPEIRLGIGIHSGRVVAGEIGNDKRKAYSLAGSNVIIAARIEQLNKKLKSQFLISKAVADEISPEHFSFKSLGEKKLKGISELIEIYQLA